MFVGIEENNLIMRVSEKKSIDRLFGIYIFEILSFNDSVLGITHLLRSIYVY